MLCTPCSVAIRLIYATPIGCRSLSRSPFTSDPCRGRGERGQLISRGRRSYAPPTPGLRKMHPCRGASSSSDPAYADHAGAEPPRDHQFLPGSIINTFPKRLHGRGPRQGSILLSPVVEARSAEDPGETRMYFGINDPAKVSVPLTITITSDTLAGSWDKRGLCLPGVFGATPLRHPGYAKCTPIGVPPPPVALSYRTSRTGRTAQQTPGIRP